MALMEEISAKNGQLGLRSFRGECSVVVGVRVTGDEWLSMVDAYQNQKVILQ
jgi:hypothetical protein